MGCNDALLGPFDGFAKRPGTSTPFGVITQWFLSPAENPTPTNTHSQVKLSIFIPRLDPECVNGIRVDGGCLDLEDVGGYRSVRADAHVFVHHRVGQLPANGV